MYFKILNAQKNPIWRRKEKRCLAGADVDVNFQNEDGCTALIHAALFADAEILNVRVEAGSDVYFMAVTGMVFIESSPRRVWRY